MNDTAQLDFHTNLPGGSPNLLLDERGADGRTLLHRTVLNGTQDEVRKLLSLGASVNIRDNLEDQPLHLVVYRDKIQDPIVQLLVNFGATADAVGSTGKTALHHAVRSYSTLLILLKSHPKLSFPDAKGNTVLHYAAFDVEKTGDAYGMLLEFGADPNALNLAGVSPFHMVLERFSRTQYDSILLLSLRHGASLRLPFPHNRLPFEIYIENMKEELVKETRWESERRSRVQTFEHLFRNGASPDTKLLSGQYLCHYLLQKRIFRPDMNPSLGRLLCEKVDVNSRGLNGNTPLLESMEEQSITMESLELLLQRGSDPNALNDQGWSPLSLAIGRPGSLQQVMIGSFYVESLVKAGANPVFYNPLGELLIYVAVGLDRDGSGFKTLKCLLASFADKHETIQPPDRGQDRHWWASFTAALMLAKRDWTKADSEFHDADFYLPDAPKKRLPSVARIVLAEHALKYHHAEILHNKDEAVITPRENLSESRRSIIAILRGCRARHIEIELTWYQILLDVIDED
jgi:ankyrin repeat protein